MADQAYIETQVEKIRQLSVERATRTWKQHTRGERVSFADLNDSLSRIVSDDRLLQAIEDEMAAGPEPLRQRELKLLRSLVLEGRITQHPDVQALHTRLVEYHLHVRATVDGQAVSAAQLQRTLAFNPDRDARRAAYEAYAQISAGAAADLTAFIKKLNELSRAAGYSDYYRFTLAQDDIDPQFLHDSLQTFKAASLAPATVAADAMAAFLEVDPLEPWDVPFAKQVLMNDLDEYFPADNAVPSLRRTLAAIGIDIDALPVTVDTEPQDSKTYAAFCFAINPPADVRVTANPLPGIGFYMRLYHEFGHALHAVCNRQNRWIFLREPACFSEGMANILSALIREPEWLSRNTNLKPHQLQRLDLLHGILAFDRRDSLARVAFELSAYHDPDRDLDAIHHERVCEYSLTPNPAGLSIWAASPLYASHPAYLHNYFLGAMIAAQTIAHLKRSGRELFTPATGQFLIESYYAPGRSIPWTEKVRRATGESLSASHLLTGD
ncbi:MAG: hypothetical protein ACM3XN_08970 [Chloroflexota bacterium]